MREFVERNVRPRCSPEFLTFCTTEEIEAIEGFSNYTAEQLDSAIESEEENIKAARDSFKEKVEEMKKMYSQWTMERDETIQKIKSGKLALLKAVRATGAAQRSVIVNDDANTPPKDVNEKRETVPTPAEKPNNMERKEHGNTDLKQEKEKKPQPDPEPETTTKDEPEMDEHDEGERVSNVADL